MAPTFFEAHVRIIVYVFDSFDGLSDVSAAIQNFSRTIEGSWRGEEMNVISLHYR